MAILLDEQCIRGLIGMPDALEAVEEVFRAQGNGEVYNVPRVRAPVKGGIVRITAAVLSYRGYYGVKISSTAVFGSNAGRMTQNHVLRLHPQAGVRHMARRKTHRHEQIDHFRPLGQQQAERDLIRLHRHLHVALVFHEAPGIDEPLQVVRIGVVAAHADRVGLHPFGLEVALRRHEFTDEPAGLAHVELVGPVAVVRELVPRESVRVDLGA